MKTLEFSTKVVDYATSEMVRGGIRIAISDEEAEVINRVMARAHEAQRFGIGTDEGLRSVDHFNTPLADRERIAYSYGVGVINDKDMYESGCNGL